MTKPEITGKRSLQFSDWIRKNLPDSSTGFAVTDIDFVLWNYKTKRMMILEIKLRKAVASYSQWSFYRLLNRWLKQSVDDGWTYLGINLIQFEKLDFSDGKCYLNYKEITEPELIKFLSMESINPDSVIP